MTDQDKAGMFFSYLCLSLAVVLAIASMMTGFGTRWAWWGFRTGLGLLKWTVYCELITLAASLLVCILAAYRRSRTALFFSLAGIVVCLAALAVPVSMWVTANRVPAIHDITTDTEDPPQFDAVLKLRADAQNPAEYGGPDIAGQQHKAYPDIVPLMLDIPPSEAFERALSLAKKKEWKIAAERPDKGLIEATDRTVWFGFKDDIVIRISSHEKGSRIDVRSVSRVGRSDVGKNACRIRNFLKELKKHV